MSSLRVLALTALFVGGLSLSLSPALADSSVAAGGDIAPTGDNGGGKGDLAQDLEVSGLHSFSSKVKHGDDGFGNVTETSSHFKYVAVPKLNDDLFLRVGVSWDRFDFGTGGLHPNFGVPSTLQSVALVLGADWKLGDQWLLRAEAAPGFYGSSDNLGSQSAAVPITVGGVYLQSEDLQWMVGLQIDYRSQYPILPAAGVRWRFADRWVLNAMVPKPRVEFELNKKTTLYAGASLDGGTFRASNGTGLQAGRPGLSGALVSYMEVGAGVGAVWKFLPGFTLDGSAGYLVYRQFDYYNSKASFTADPAPYVSLSVGAKF